MRWDVFPGSSSADTARLRDGFNLFSVRLSLNLHSVGSLNRIENHGIVKVSQDLDVGHDAMTADDSREVLDRGEELYFLVKCGDLFIVLSRLVTISLGFLRPG